MNKIHIFLILFLTSIIGLIVSLSAQTINVATEKTDLKATQLTSGFNHPWSMVWLDSRTLLISERNGDLIIYNLDDKKKHKIFLPKTIEVFKGGQGGLLDLALDPNFDSNLSGKGWIYLTFSLKKNRKNTTALARFKIINNHLKSFEVLFEARPYKNSAYHFGSRLSFSSANLFMSVGERAIKYTAQDRNAQLGKIIRFQYKKNFNPEIYSIGHRNPQGMVWDKLSSQLFANEHGAKGGDELNIIKKGYNYGWPVISYGKNYNGSKIGEGNKKKGMEQPIYYWDPSIAPSAMIVYSGKQFLNWKSNIILLSLKFGRLVRLELNHARNKVIHQEQIFNKDFGRLRYLSEDSQGRIYLLTDSASGNLIMLEKP